MIRKELKMKNCKVMFYYLVSKMLRLHKNCLSSLILLFFALTSFKNIYHISKDYIENYLLEVYNRWAQGCDSWNTLSITSFFIFQGYFTSLLLKIPFQYTLERRS